MEVFFNNKAVLLHLCGEEEGVVVLLAGHGGKGERCGTWKVVDVGFPVAGRGGEDRDCVHGPTLSSSSWWIPTLPVGKVVSLKRCCCERMAVKLSRWFHRGGVSWRAMRQRRLPSSSPSAAPLMSIRSGSSKAVTAAELLPVLVERRPICAVIAQSSTSSAEALIGAPRRSFPLSVVKWFVPGCALASGERCSSAVEKEPEDLIAFLLLVLGCSLQKF